LVLNKHAQAQDSKEQESIPWRSDDEFPKCISSQPSRLVRGQKEQDVAPEPPRTPDKEVRTPSPTPCSGAVEFTPVTIRFRQSKRIGKVPVHEGNIYGETWHSVKQFQDIQ
jgi:hypothetical protein